MHDMKKFLNLVLITLAIVLLTGCNLLGERHYGEGDEVRVLINLADNQSTNFFVNLHIFNDSDEARRLRIEGFEYLENDEWILIPPVDEYEWMLDFMPSTLQPSGQQDDRTSTVMSFNDWLNPDYPTLGEFRAVIRVYDLDGNYQFTQTSNTRILEYFRFE